MYAQLQLYLDQKDKDQIRKADALFHSGALRKINQFQRNIWIAVFSDGSNLHETELHIKVKSLNYQCDCGNFRLYGDCQHVTALVYYLVQISDTFRKEKTADRSLTRLAVDLSQHLDPKHTLLLIRKMIRFDPYNALMLLSRFGFSAALSLEDNLQSLQLILNYKWKSGTNKTRWKSAIPMLLENLAERLEEMYLETDPLTKTHLLASVIRFCQSESDNLGREKTDLLLQRYYQLLIQTLEENISPEAKQTLTRSLVELLVETDSRHIRNYLWKKILSSQIDSYYQYLVSKSLLQRFLQDPWLQEDEKAERFSEFLILHQKQVKEQDLYTIIDTFDPTLKLVLPVIRRLSEPSFQKIQAKYLSLLLKQYQERINTNMQWQYFLFSHGSDSQDVRASAAHAYRICLWSDDPHPLQAVKTWIREHSQEFQNVIPKEETSLLDHFLRMQESQLSQTDVLLGESPDTWKSVLKAQYLRLDISEVIPAWQRFLSHYMEAHLPTHALEFLAEVGREFSRLGLAEAAQQIFLLLRESNPDRSSFFRTLQKHWTGA